MTFLPIPKDKLITKQIQKNTIEPEDISGDIIDKRNIAWYISSVCGVSKEIGEKAFDIIANHMCEEIIQYDSYTIRGIGKLYKVYIKPYNTYSVFANEEILHPQHIRLYFKFSETFKRSLNGRISRYKDMIQTEKGMKYLESSYNSLKEKRRMYGTNYPRTRVRTQKIKPLHISE